MISIEIIKETLTNLLETYDSDKKLFHKTYKSLPFDIYKEIERLSVSKSVIYKEICDMSKAVADNFHKNIK